MDRLAAIIINEKYNKIGMDDLPAVKNDHENIRHTVLMMGIPDSEDNIFEIKNGTWNQMNELEV